MKLTTPALAAAAALISFALAAPAAPAAPASSSSSTPSASASPGLDGFEIDPALPDGHYSITIHQNGSHHIRRWTPHAKRWHTLEKRQGTGEYTFLVDDANGTVKALSLDSFSSQRLPLPEPQTQCIHHREYGPLSYPLIPDDYYASKLALYNYCDVFQFVEGHVSMALDGNVAVYVCQRRVTSLGHNTCAEAEFKAAEALLNKTCGNSPGYVWISDWNKEYGRLWKGERLCRRWSDMRYNEYKGPAFEDPKGAGKLTLEPEGDYDKTPEELYMKAAFEPVKPSKDDDDGQRRDFRGMYGQFADGWGNGWGWPDHPKYPDKNKDA